MYDAFHIILVEPTHPGNIGSAARAMKTMGFKQLTLVNPKIFPSSHATALASGAEDILENARVVATVEEAIADCSHVIGTSTRSRRLPIPVYTARESAERLTALPGAPRVGILFGQERSGLTNEALSLCHFHVTIPTGPDAHSLNLAMAVQVICYELSIALLTPDNTPQAKTIDRPATAQELQLLEEHMMTVLEAIGFYDPRYPKKLLPRLKRLIKRMQLEEMEVNILRGILAMAEQKAELAKAATES